MPLWQSMQVLPSFCACSIFAARPGALLVRIHRVPRVAVAAFVRIVALHRRPDMLRELHPLRLEFLRRVDRARDEFAVELLARLDLAHELVHPVLRHMAVRSRSRARRSDSCSGWSPCIPGTPCRASRGTTVQNASWFVASIPVLKPPQNMSPEIIPIATTGDQRKPRRPQEERAQMGSQGMLRSGFFHGFVRRGVETAIRSRVGDGAVRDAARKCRRVRHR